MKKRPLVCQFASPLDVDIHNTPQVSTSEPMFSVFFDKKFVSGNDEAGNKLIDSREFIRQAIILEGKYWKRKWKVITAEYKKWRRFNVNKAFGSSNIDTVSRPRQLFLSKFPFTRFSECHETLLVSKSSLQPKRSIISVLEISRRLI